MLVKGLQKTSAVDYPGNLACTIFLPACNFRCPFCYNKDLVLDPDKLETVNLDELFALLVKRKGLIDGVVITGGEPCLQKDLPEFIKKIKGLGLKVKLDTNGCFPEMLKLVLPYIDYVAMDIKGSKENYDKCAGVKVNMSKIQESIDLIKGFGVDYEFRLTLVSSLHSEKDLMAIASWLKGSKKFCLQQFQRDFDLLNESYKNTQLYTPDELNDFKKKLEPFFGKVEVRGL